MSPLTSKDRIYHLHQIIFGYVPRILRNTLREEFGHKHKTSKVNGVSLLLHERWITPYLNRIESSKVTTSDMIHWDTTLLSKVLLNSRLLTEALKIDSQGVMMKKKKALNHREFIVRCCSSLPTYIENDLRIILGIKNRLLFHSNLVTHTNCSSGSKIVIQIPVYKEKDTCAALSSRRFSQLMVHVCTPKWHAVKNLRDVRNSFNHRSNCSISSDEFQETMNRVKMALSWLNVTPCANWQEELHAI